MKYLLRVAASVFAAVTLWMTLRAAPSIQIGVFLLGATTLAYSRLKRLPLAKTIIIALAWTLGPATLPFAGTTNPLPWWKLDLIPSLLLLLAANGILCDLKDREHDNKEGILTLPVLIGPRKTCLFATGLLGLSVTLSLSRHHPELAVTGIALAIAAQFPSLLEREIAGPLIADAILILPGILLQIGVA
jgi:4-hydroxybenzoate polyprenyltransferase